MGLKMLKANLFLERQRQKALRSHELKLAGITDESKPLCYVVMRNGHIMPPGIHMHFENAEATAEREEGTVIPLYTKA